MLTVCDKGPQIPTQSRTHWKERRGSDSKKNFHCLIQVSPMFSNQRFKERLNTDTSEINDR